MKKAIQLKIKVWIEGEDEPTHDFTKLTLQAMHDIFAAGRSRHPELAITVREIVEDRDYDDESQNPTRT